MFSPATADWFGTAFAGPTEVQRRGWPVLQTGRHALLLAPTGSGKTLAAFLMAIDSLISLRPDDPGVKVLYISPLKALVHDIERNLQAPLVGTHRSAERLGLPARKIAVDIRTGDTPQRERRRQARDPADILVTTPESLYLLLGSRARESLRTVRTVIVDEVHALAPTKRGAHLALSLERLSMLANTDPQRIGLSATVRPPEDVARFLGGDREVTVIDTAQRPNLDLQVIVPVPDMARIVPAAAEPQRRSDAIPEDPLLPAGTGRPKPERGLWPAIYPGLLEQIRANRSTIIFVNSRGLCERLAQRLNDEAGEELVLAHHGSVSHEKRAEIEENLKRGGIRGIIATSSLELGIDMGAVDRVILVESPGSVARGLQRVGRAGHQVGTTSVGRIFPKFRGDLLECAVIAQRMLQGELEPIRVPQNALDVLAQQLVAHCVEQPRTVDGLLHWLRRAHSYRALSRAMLEAVLDMLSGRYPSDEFADLRPLLSWDRSRDLVAARHGAALRTRLNGGTIPDRGNYTVHLGPDGPRVGELDEEMVFETRIGDCILLGATTWRVEDITRDRVLVSPAPGEPGRLPFWRGDGPGRPIAVGRAIGEMLRAVEDKSPAETQAWLTEHLPLDELAAENLAAYLAEQREHTGTLPTDRSLTVERFRDELGDWRVCILSPFGARIHAPWAMAIQQGLAERSGFEVQLLYSDDGIVLRFADVDELPALEDLLPDPDEVEHAVTEQLAHTALFASLFRENAVRSLLLPRGRPGSRNPLWAQRLKSQSLLAAVRPHPSFPLVLETYRQALSDQFDLEGLQQLMRDVRSRRVRVVEVETRSASPFARSLVFAYVAAYIYQQDAPLAERRAQALTLDRKLLGELLGQAELRELLDEAVIGEVEQELQQLAVDRRARDPDELHDLLRRLGDLNGAEIAARCRSADPKPWLARLADERRASEIRISGELRWIAAEDAGLYRDAFGTVPPTGLPAAHLEPVPRPLDRMVARYARTHGPFLTGQLARRYGVAEAQADAVLRHLEQGGQVIYGEIRPGGVEPDWCHAEVLRRIKGRTLAKLRNQAAPLDASVLGVFLPLWHGIGGNRSGPGRLLEVVGQLEGLVLPWSVLSRTLLPARVAGFKVEMLDMLAAAGRVVWVGRGALGSGDGRIVLYRREHAAALLPDPESSPPDALLHRAVLEHLQQHGASFLFELESAARAVAGTPPVGEFQAALWDLVWAGCITNDGFAPLQGLGRRVARSTRGRQRAGRMLAGGRWSLVGGLTQQRPPDTERLLARADVMLGRYGVVSREAVLAEGWPGGYGPIHKVLRTMEETGKIRRGYFIEGLAGSQFGDSGAIDRLRGCRSGEGREETVEQADFLALAALDPANPYGALLPWPENSASLAPRRVAGAWVVLWRGSPALYAAQNGRQVIRFAEPPLPEAVRDGAFEVLRRLPMAGRKGFLVIERIDGLPVRDSPLYGKLRSIGFESDPRGLVATPAG